jgi:hypothetical protein
MAMFFALPMTSRRSPRKQPKLIGSRRREIEILR